MTPRYPKEIERIIAGGLPNSPEARLAELRGGAFSSFLSVNEFAVAAELGMRPIAQVVGASGCRLATGVTRTTRPGQGRARIGAARWLENDGTSRSWTAARERALGRLRKQAESVGANAVVGLRVERRDTTMSEMPALELIFTGTAVDWPESKYGDVVLSMLPLQEHARLVRAGVEPVGIAGATANVHVRLSNETAWALANNWRWARNRPLDELTEGLYEARRLALERLRADAARAGATGVLGADLSHRSERVGSQFHVTLHLMATAIRVRDRVRPVAAAPVVRMGSTA
jgi:uncharacterized protein YbjQ (UPF0145 family)